MLNTASKLEKSVMDLIQTATGDFSEGTIKTQNSLFRSLKGLINELGIDANGNIKRTASNRRVLNKLRRSILPLIMTDTYKARVSKFASSYNKLGAFSDEYFSFIVESFTNNEELFNEIKSQAVDLTISSLTESGLETNLVNPVRNMLNQNITSGASLMDLEDQLRDFITGTDKRLGALERYTGQITRDALNQFSANYNEAISSDLGLDWFFYTRGTVDDSREFCIHRNGKYFHRKEVESWGNIKQWQGRIPGTNSSTIFIFRGGYSCMHQISPVSERVVPASVKARAKAKGYIS